MKALGHLSIFIAFAMLPAFGVAYAAPAGQAQAAQPLPPMVTGNRGVVRTYPSPTVCQSNCIAIQRFGHTDVITWRGINGKVKKIFAASNNGGEQTAIHAGSVRPNGGQTGECVHSGSDRKNCVEIIHTGRGYDVVVAYGPQGQIIDIKIVYIHTRPK